MSIFSPYVIIAIVVAVLGAYGGGRLQQYARDQASFQKKMDDAIAQAAAEKAAIELARQKERESAELKQQEIARERDKQMARSAKRIADLDAAVASLRAPGIGKLLNDTIGEAGGIARTPAKSGESPAAVAANSDTSIGLWAQWSVTCINLYATARDQILGFQDFYNKLRMAN